VSTEDEVASFVAARRQGLTRYGFMLAGDLASGEDLVQEALVRCLPSWGRLDPQGVEATSAR
jgi:DNA-directed RNA polymerase specialized sigma24 family protein